MEGRKNELEVIQYMKVSAHIGMQYMKVSTHIDIQYMKVTTNINKQCGEYTY